MMGAIFEAPRAVPLNDYLTEADLPPALIAVIRNVYLPAGLQLTGRAQREAESAEYGAARLELDGQHVVFRVAKITPIKLGQFVTLWKRPAGSAPAALDSTDAIAFVVVSVSDAGHHGQFVFDQQTLIAKGVMSLNGTGGKCAMRVYPPWVKPVAKQAIKTQQWQVQHFVALGEDASAEQIRRLFRV